jgi:hypothetical protein
MKKVVITVAVTALVLAVIPAPASASSAPKMLLSVTGKEQCLPAVLHRPSVSRPLAPQVAPLAVPEKLAQVAGDLGFGFRRLWHYGLNARCRCGRHHEATHSQRPRHAVAALAGSIAVVSVFSDHQRATLAEKERR